MQESFYVKAAVVDSFLLAVVRRQEMCTDKNYCKSVGGMSAGLLTL